MGRASLQLAPVHIGEAAGRPPDTPPGIVRVALRRELRRNRPDRNIPVRVAVVAT